MTSQVRRHNGTDFLAADERAIGRCARARQEPAKAHRKGNTTGLSCHSVRAADVRVGRSRTAMASSTVQDIQDAARPDGVRPAAAGAQGFQVSLQRAQFADSLAHMPNVFVEQGIDLATALRRCVMQTQQG